MNSRWMGALVFVLAMPRPAGATVVTYRNLVHTSLGAATLTLGGDSLKVSNLGSSGSDGVMIALPAPGDFHIDHAPAHIPSGGYMAFAAVAGSDTISFGRVSPVNDSSQLEVAFKDLPGITAYRVQAYLGGVLQRTADVPISALPVTAISTLPQDNICIRCFFKKVGNWIEDNVSITHGTIKVIMPDLSIVTVQTVGIDHNFLVAHGHIGDDPVAVSFDNLVVFPVGSTVSVPTRDRVVITAANHPGLTLRGEAIAPILPMAGRSTWWFAGALLLMVGAVALRARRARATEA
jgi:hypothetical protein